MLDLVRKLPVFAAGKDQAGQVEDLAPGQLAGDRHDQVAGLNPDDGRGPDQRTTRVATPAEMGVSA